MPAPSFKDLAIENLEGTYHRLLVAPNSMKTRITALIDRGNCKRPQGLYLPEAQCHYRPDLIQKLREASQAGVQVEMIVRGICCILPQVEGETENIRVTSIVGRYLEHARFTAFGKDAEELMFISSADFMTRNMDHRVEVGCPIDSPQVRQKKSTAS